MKQECILKGKKYQMYKNLTDKEYHEAIISLCIFNRIKFYMSKHAETTAHPTSGTYNVYLSQDKMGVFFAYPRHWDEYLGR